MEEDKQIQVVTGSDSTEKHQNAHPQPAENMNGDECPFEISSIRLSGDQEELSDDHDESPLEGVEEAPKSPIMPPPSPFRTRWVRGMQNPNKSFGSPNVQSPIKKFTPTSKEHTASQLSKDFDAADLAKEFLDVDKSALDASAVTKSLLESSFTGPDSTNARLEAAYMWTKRENNSLLKKIKDLEEAAAEREQEKLDLMMTSMDAGSPLKWAKDMIGETPDSGSPKDPESDMDGMKMPPKLDRKTELPTQLYPTELNDLALPTLSPTTINSELRTNGSSNFEETAETARIGKKARPSPFRQMMLLFLCALACTILSVHRARVEFVLKAAMLQAANILKKHEHRINHITKRVSETRDLVHARLQPAQEFIMPYMESAITVCQHKYKHYSQVAAEDLEKLQLLLGLKLDWELDILPMAKHYSGKTSDAPLEGMNVVVVRASTEVGKDLIDVFSKLGARVMAVDGSAKYLTTIKASKPSVNTMKIDFTDLISTAKGAVDIVESFSRIDILVNCANSYTRDFGETKQGYDKHFGTNYLSEFLLTTKLLEPLANSSRGTLVHVQSMAHILVDGSDLQVEEAAKQPFASVPGDVNSILAHSSSLLASSLHNQYLGQTQKQVTITSVTSTPFIPAMSVRAVLASIFGETDQSVTDSVHSSLKQAKHKLGVFKDQVFGAGEFANPFEDEELMEGLMEWSEEAVSPYWWTKIEPKTVDILKEAGSCVYDALESETSEYNAFYTSSVVTILSVGSLSLLRQLMPSSR